MQNFLLLFELDNVSQNVLSLISWFIWYMYFWWMLSLTGTCVGSAIRFVPWRIFLYYVCYSISNWYIENYSQPFVVDNFFYCGVHSKFCCCFHYYVLNERIWWNVHTYHSSDKHFQRMQFDGQREYLFSDHFSIWKASTILIQCIDFYHIHDN